jgi:hypothetical protein
LRFFEDNPEKLAGWVREKHAVDHFAYLKVHADTIRLAGGLRPNPDDWFIGRLCAIEANTRQQR